ncbi:diguanylate cyclase [Pelosinus sp. sgz500959]|uniref:diguanylate cyclase n=1 Tax=Pelosinus sp. sgz500959 TaxID=3242472 RepID=UPI00366E0390
MTEVKKSVSERMKILRATYARELSGKVGGIEDEWRVFLISDDYQTHIHNLIRSFHTLAGSTASFGYRHLSEVARKGEEFLKSTIEDGKISKMIEQEINICLQNMKQLCKYQQVQKHIEFSVENTSAESPSDQQRGKRIIFIVEDDVQLATNMTLELECFGYDVMTFHHLKEMEQALLHVTPAAIIMDMVFPEGDIAGAKAISRWRVTLDHHIPVVFISQRNDIISRLEAVKAGSDAYFLKPVRVSDLIDKLENLINKVEHEPYRILIVDDDEVLAEYHSVLLEQHGMRSCIVNNPLTILESLSKYTFDLILLDLTMPGCDGHNLAKVIRQVPAYFSIPIVFLSGETQLEVQLQAMGTGGDDFLTKPVEPKHFISSVRIRAERMRMLRSFMECDGLSGLYTHTVMKGHIEQEFLRSMRNNSPLTLAVLDLDHFKRVNDTYGHVTGDMVIVVLARLLKQRLRRTDIIGRMGGEEFAVILPDTSIEFGYRVIEDVRRSFERISHQTQDCSFCSTFSCGIAQMPGYIDEISFYKAADMAMYDAKEAGRNQICIAKNERME